MSIASNISTANSRRKAVIGVDIGGTKAAYCAYAVVNGRIMENPIVSGSIASEKGTEGLANTMNTIYQDVTSNLPDYDILAAGVGIPGRPLSISGAKEGSFVAAPNSVYFLEQEKGELDNADLQPVLQRGIPVPVYVANDAVTQMLAMLDNLLTTLGKTDLYGNKVAYIGVGTGLGGGFAEVNKTGKVTVNTDGHIWDIDLALSPADREMLQAANAFHKSNRDYDRMFSFSDDGDMVAAEILSGTSLKKLTGYSGEALENDPALLAAHRHDLEFMGRCLAELVANIHSGVFTKTTPEAQWPAEDLERVKGTTRFLIGGGVASNTNIRSIIVDAAQEDLARKGIEDIKFMWANQKDTQLAAAYTVPTAVLTQSKDDRSR